MAIMCSVLQITLLLFTVLCSATNPNLYNSNYRTAWPGHLASRRAAGCIDPTNFWDIQSYTFFYSNEVRDASFNFSISTRYTRFYPTTLWTLLRVSGYSMTSRHSVDISEYCGWQDAGVVKANGMTRGHILWKYNDLRLERAPLNSGNMTMWQANRADHIPPHISERPNGRTIAHITRLLLDIGPYADFYFNCATCFAVLCGVLVSCIWFGFACKVVRIRRDRRMALMMMNDGNRNDVELTTINTQRAPGSKSFETTRSEPPPLYSVDGPSY